MKQQLKLFAVTMAVALPANAHSGPLLNRLPQLCQGLMSPKPTKSKLA